MAGASDCCGSFSEGGRVRTSIKRLPGPPSARTALGGRIGGHALSQLRAAMDARPPGEKFLRSSIPTSRGRQR
jgi:hypothetical protein